MVKMKKIALRAGKNPFQPLTLKETALRGVSATNVGNMVFSEAAFKTLSTNNVDVAALGYAIHTIDPQRINEHYDAVVLPFANAFRLEWKEQLIAYTQFVQQLKVPVIVMGIGVQTDFDYDLECLKPIAKETKALVSAVLDRSHSIGVRGEASKEFLKKLGFRDEYVDVIGCPSMFRYGSYLPLDITKLHKSSDRANYALNMTPCGLHDKGVRKGNHKLLKFVDHNINKYDRADLITQENRSLLTMLWGRALGKGLEYDGLSSRSTQLLDAGRAKQFVNPRTWIDFLSKKDFVIGSRIHGNITGLLSGTPSYVLASDSRTREICEYFHIPFQRLSEVSARFDIEDFINRADYSKLISNYPDKFKHYVEFLNNNGLDNCFDSRGAGEYFEEKLRKVDFPSEASGVKSGSLLKYKYLIARIEEKVRQNL